MSSFLQLAKNCKQDMADLTSYRLALLGDCATQHLATALKGYAYTLDLRLDIFDADYDQILPLMMDSSSPLYTFAPDAVLIYMCVEKLYAAWCEAPQESREGFAVALCARIREQWRYIAANCSASVLQFTFAEADDLILGNLALRQPVSFIYQIRKLNMLLMDAAAEHGNVFLVDLCGLQARIGRDTFFDPKLYYLAKMPIALPAMGLVSSSVLGVVQALRGVIKKCVVLDLDHTLWGGVIGDDGMSGIQIGELGAGHAFSEFQTWLKELKKRGILLAVCSKNDEETAREPFIKHCDMVLKLEDFAMFVANWEDKAANIQRIQQTLQIGMDSIIFIDDNPFERNLVRTLLPQVTVPELPADPAEYLRYLKSLNLFETASYSNADAARTEQYRAEAQREALRHKYADYDDYLRSLDMLAKAAPFDDFHAPRIAQLSQRSNQFNLRTVRYTLAQIAAAARNPRRITLYFTLKDKLADHGLISVVIMEALSDTELFIDTWLMSCRVLKRGMEEFIVNKMIDTARDRGFATVTGEYIPTPKNAMVKDIYETLGFTRTDENRFTAHIGAFVYNKTFIKEQCV